MMLWRRLRIPGHTIRCVWFYRPSGWRDSSSVAAGLLAVELSKKGDGMPPCEGSVLWIRVLPRGLCVDLRPEGTLCLTTFSRQY